VRSVRQELEKAVQLGKTISPEVMVIVANLDDPGRLADLVASNLELKLADAQVVLEELDPTPACARSPTCWGREMQLLAMQQEIASHARDEMDKSQREYFLRQQLKAIQQELGEGDDLAEEIAGWRQKADERSLPDSGARGARRQIKRLERSHPDSAEAAITRTYLDWLTGLPWGLTSEDRLDLAHAARCSTRTTTTSRRSRSASSSSSPCASSRPTPRGRSSASSARPASARPRSAARSRARWAASSCASRSAACATRRRSAATAAPTSARCPGASCRASTRPAPGNPVFMLDEIDKLGADYRGDPSAALLEVLDPEQNDSFRDHYLGIEYDLSKVMFIATANLLEPIHPAFRDRMEVVRLSGYTEEEKLHIARRHLIPKLVERHGIGPEHVVFTDAGLHRILSGYTRERGCATSSARSPPSAARWRSRWRRVAPPTANAPSRSRW
jgi:ATP-dependent Lon protease